MPDPITLYAIPYAGGHSLVYRNLKQYLYPSVTLKTLELSGRGSRAREPLIRDVEEIAQDLLGKIRGDITEGSYALFGHSMGSLLAYLLCRSIAEEGLPLPRQLFCSGHAAPASRKKDPSFAQAKYSLSADDFWEYIDSLGALPPEVKDHEELMSYFEPILRADIQALECFEYRPVNRPLDVPIAVFYGIDDRDTPLHSLLPWQIESRSTVSYFPFEGGHFGLFEQLPEFSQILNRFLGFSAGL
ncbi:MAG: alpha/beta fold hydrolase [Balneolaceae bacterium]